MGYYYFLYYYSVVYMYYSYAFHNNRRNNIIILYAYIIVYRYCVQTSIVGTYCVHRAFRYSNYPMLVFDFNEFYLTAIWNLNREHLFEYNKYIIQPPLYVMIYNSVIVIIIIIIIFYTSSHRHKHIVYTTVVEYKHRFVFDLSQF